MKRNVNRGDYDKCADRRGERWQFRLIWRENKEREREVTKMGLME